MTEHELTELSKKVFNEVVEQIEFPENVHVTKNENDEYSFTQILSNNTGQAVFYYKPSLFIVKEYLRNPERLEEAVGKNLTEEFTVVTSQALLYGLLNNFHCEIEEAFGHFMDNPFLLMCEIMNSVAKKDNLNIKIKERTNKTINEITSERNKIVRGRIKNQIDDIGKHDKVPNKNLIEIFYSNILKSWKEAKRFYKQNSKFPNWEKMALIAFPDLPLDLILRLDNPDPYLSMPSSIALENAARLCGFKDNSIELRTLQNYLKESRLYFNNKTEEEKQKHLNSFLTCVSEQVIMAMKISESLETDVNLENYSLIHQILYYKATNIEQEKTSNNENQGNEEFH